MEEGLRGGGIFVDDKNESKIIDSVFKLLFVKIKLNN